MKLLRVIALVVITLLITTTFIYAEKNDEGAASTEQAQKEQSIGAKQGVGIYFAFAILASAIGIGIASCGCGIGMGIAISKGLEGSARQPEMYGKIQTLLIIGLAMIESLAIYALVISLIILYANPFAKFFI